jgi:uncharacterized protein YraI
MDNNQQVRFNCYTDSTIWKRKAGLPERLILLCLSLLLITACSGSAARGRPTPLPPGTPLPQPTPLFVAPQPSPQPSPTATVGEPASDEGGEAATGEEARAELQARLLTRIAQGSAGDATPSTLPASGPLSGTISSGGTLLYHTPGTYILRNLPGGMEVTASGRSADGLWYAVHLENGEAGWVSAIQIRIAGDGSGLPFVDQVQLPEESTSASNYPGEDRSAPAPTMITPDRTAPPQAVAADSSMGERAVVAVETLNVRAGPGTHYAIVTSLRQNQPVAVQARNAAGDWLQIRVENAPDGVGWVYAPLVTTTLAVNALPTAAIIPTPAAVATPAAAAGQAAQTQAAPAQGLQGTLVFQERSGGTIYRYTLQTGDLKPLTHGADPAISPDSRTVAFARHGGQNGIYLINIDGSNERRIFGGNVPSSPKWRPDGNQILFSHITGQAEPCRMTLMFGCIPQSEVDQLLQDFADMLPPDFTLDRWPLVEISLENLSIIDVNGNGYRDLPSLSSVTAPDWGTWGIVYQSRGGLEITEMGEGATSRGLVQSHLYQDPAWQPGGERIAFQSREGNRWEIFIVNSDGAGLSPLTRPPMFAREQPHSVAPAWSPDGKWIVFLSNRSGKWALWVMDSSGGNQQQLPIDLPFDYNFGAEQVVSWGP